MRRLAVFCGSQPGGNPAYLAACAELADALVRRNIELVYGAGNIGLMGALADAVLARGGHVIGVIPRLLVEREVAHKDIQDLRIVDTMHQRKALMAQLSDAFLALPGGIGTLEEIIEVFTWSQIGFHDKPCGFLNTGGYYDRLFTFLDQMVEEGFLRVPHRGLLAVATEPVFILDELESRLK
jgi:uncharacterized protein (TIGR00730 family)